MDQTKYGARRTILDDDMGFVFYCVLLFRSPLRMKYMKRFDFLAVGVSSRGLYLRLIISSAGTTADLL